MIIVINDFILVQILLFLIFEYNRINIIEYNHQLLPSNNPNALTLVVQNRKPIKAFIHEILDNIGNLLPVEERRHRLRHYLISCYQFITHRYLFIEEWKLLRHHSLHIHAAVEDSTCCEGNEKSEDDW